MVIRPKDHGNAQNTRRDRASRENTFRSGFTRKTRVRGINRGTQYTEVYDLANARIYRREIQRLRRVFVGINVIAAATLSDDPNQMNNTDAAFERSRHGRRRRVINDTDLVGRGIFEHSRRFLRPDQRPDAVVGRHPCNQPLANVAIRTCYDDSILHPIRAGFRSVR